MPIKSESGTPPPRIGKIGPYTVFVTPPATPSPSASPKPESPRTPVQQPVHLPSPPPVMAPPAQFYKEKPSSFAFFWNTVAKVQNAHASLDEHVAHWFGLNQSKYQWALDDYYESNGKRVCTLVQGRCEYCSVYELWCMVDLRKTIKIKFKIRKVNKRPLKPIDENKARVHAIDAQHEQSD
ncbi:hypothetical protein Sango_0828300 [Sesamum angolense]|uniref:Uncharacterized protein n=1 Tax=Sesamum angolense TaxID=2727404 RepID=A0AAE2C0J0_9LAMI|nr:hypothetical protein Sango_0828300 [Sesamum angolense]